MVLLQTQQAAPTAPEPCTRGVAVGVSEARDDHAPDDHGLVERWNWWMGALELAYGGYRQFGVNRYASD